MAVVETLTEKEEIVITMDELPLLKIGQFHYQEMRELKMNYLVRKILMIIRTVFHGVNPQH